MKNEKNDMMDAKTTEQLEKLWLTYYNDTLLAKGVITEDQHTRMCVKINNRTKRSR